MVYYIYIFYPIKKQKLFVEDCSLMMEDTQVQVIYNTIFLIYKYF